MLYGAEAAFDAQANDVADWLPEDSLETETIYWFSKRFGTDAILVVSWPGCTLDDERLDRMREGLVNAEFSGDGESPEPFFQNVFTGQDTLEHLTEPPISLSREQAIARMRGWLVGPDKLDNPATCAVAFLPASGWDHRAAAVEAIHDITHSLGMSSTELRLGGPAGDVHCADSSDD